MRFCLPILLCAIAAFFQASVASAQSTPLPRTYVFGTSCGGTTPGSAQISIDAATVADLGDTLKVLLTGAPANIAVALNIDTKIKALNGTPAALKRFRLASPSCTAQVNPYTSSQGISYWTTTNSNGEAFIDLKIPDHSAYDGTRFNMQWMLAASGTSQPVTLSDAISTVMRREVELRNVIGTNNSKVQGRVPVSMSNTAPVGTNSYYYVVPVPVQSSVDVRLKRLRLVGGNGSPGPTAPGSMDFHVWNTLANAASSYANGNVYNGWIAAAHVKTPYGTSYYGQPIEERVYNVLNQTQGLSFNANTVYYVGMSVETLLYAGWGISDTSSPSCVPDTLVGPGIPGGFLLTGSPFASGCVALDLVGTSLF